MKPFGMGLPEVLISLFLTSLILTLITPVYLSNKRLYVETQKQIEDYLDMQWVRALLNDSIRRAGFTPCLRLEHLKIVDRRNRTRTIHGFISANSPQAFIQVNRMSEHFSSILNISNPNVLLISTKLNLKEGHPVLISDCEHAEIQEILTLNQRNKRYQLTLKKPLLFTYDTSAYVGEWLEERWFIRENAKKEAALYYKSSQVEELTPLVKSLTTLVKTVEGKLWIEVFMTLANNKTEELALAIRGS